LSRFIDRDEEGDEIVAETVEEVLTGDDLNDLMNRYADYGGFPDTLAVFVSVPGAVAWRGLQRAQLLKNEKGDWCLLLTAEGSNIP
jgi:hypothetical protein